MEADSTQFIHNSIKYAMVFRFPAPRRTSMSGDVGLDSSKRDWQSLMELIWTQRLTMASNQPSRASLSEDVVYNAAHWCICLVNTLYYTCCCMVRLADGYYWLRHIVGVLQFLPHIYHARVVFGWRIILETVRALGSNGAAGTTTVALDRCVPL